MGGKRIRGLKARVGLECCISREGQIEQKKYTIESEEEGTVLVGGDL